MATMTDIVKIVLTSGLTIVGGCRVFVVQRFLLDPVNDQSRTLGRIAFAIHYYGKDYGNPIIRDHADNTGQQPYREVSDRLRELGSSLAETSQGVRVYWFWTLLGMVPRRERVDKAYRLLTRMSNSMFASDLAMQTEHRRTNEKDADEVLQLLGLRRWGSLPNTAAKK